MEVFILAAIYWTGDMLSTKKNESVSTAYRLEMSEKEKKKSVLISVPRLTLRRFLSFLL